MHAARHAAASKSWATHGCSWAILRIAFGFFSDSCRKVFLDRFVKQQTGRLQYLDWMRGLAALIMLQGHAFDSWLPPEQRSGELFWLSQFLGGLPAPIFLFLVGVSLALVLDRQRAKDTGSLS